MSENPDNISGSRALDRPQKESLISLIALIYIEEFSLLNTEQLNDARVSLQSLFVRATGEETMLRKLIDTLRAQKAVNQTFSDMSKILAGIGKSRDSLHLKLDKFKKHLKSMDISPDENAAFIGPFLEFSADFASRVVRFQRQMNEYLESREREAQHAEIFRIAREARERLKQRISHAPGQGDNENVEEMKEKLFQNFDYGEAEANYEFASREANNLQAETEKLLDEFKVMCQYAMNPNMRDPLLANRPFQEAAHQDVFALFVSCLKKYPRLESIKPMVLDLFRVFQHAHGIFHLDFEKFNQAIAPMRENTETYFRSKEEDLDIRTKREKLEKIEGLILFLEEASKLLEANLEFTYTKFSVAISDIIMKPGTPWAHIVEDLLPMKVTAEAELSTRLN